MGTKEQKFSYFWKFQNEKMKKDFFSTKRNIYLLFLAVSLILFGNTLKNKYAVDDNLVFQNNPVIERGLSGIPEDRKSVV